MVRYTVSNFDLIRTVFAGITEVCSVDLCNLYHIPNYIYVYIYKIRTYNLYLNFPHGSINVMYLHIPLEEFDMATRT